MKPWIKRIRELMQQRSITQEALANQMGKGQSWLNHKLSGRRKINVEDIFLIADALEIEPAALLENVTNYDRLADRMLGIAEPDAGYINSSLAEFEQKLSKLDKDAAEQFLKETHLALDKIL